MYKFNKGEWAEIYVFLRSLSIGKFYIKDSSLSKKLNELEIITLFKENFERTNEKRFSPKIINKGEYDKVALKLFDIIKNNDKTTFEIIELEKFSKENDFSLMKGSSYSKNDLDGVVKDFYNVLSPRLGYSIKSKISSTSTLLNASLHTNFLYEVSGLSKEQVRIINSIKTKTKLKDRINKIKEFKGEILLKGATSDIFKANLNYLDTGLEIILGTILLYFYNERLNSIVELIDKLSIENPLSYNGKDKVDFYKNKIIRFLKAITFEMMPSKDIVETKKFLPGGILLVNSLGEIDLLDERYYPEELSMYLYKNLKLESPSSTRYHMLELKSTEEESEKYNFTLNLQIRFI